MSCNIIIMEIEIHVPGRMHHKNDSVPIKARHQTSAKLEVPSLLESQGMCRCTVYLI